MTSDPPVTTERTSPEPVSSPTSDRRTVGTSEIPCQSSTIHGILLVFGGWVAVALIALLDLKTGPYLSCSIFYLIPVAACAWWGGFPHGILVSLAGTFAWVLIDTIETPIMPPFAGVWNGLVRFCTLTLISSLVSRLHSGVRRERRLARTDPLTGAANARTFYETAASEAERVRRTFKPLTLAYLDLDNFKQLNDRLGHATGDEALRRVVHTIHNNLGGQGLLARLGGDEFALLLPELGPDGAVALLNRLQGLLAQELASKGWPVSMSVGAITFLRPAWDVDLMIRRVDALMYGAKRKGKNRLEHSVIREDQQPHATDRRRTQRRATARVLCGCTVRVRGEGDQQAGEELATVCDISVTGVGLSLEKPFPLDTILVIEPLSEGAMALLARVVRVGAEGSRWIHGCTLSHRLNSEELSGWLGATNDTKTPPPATPSQKLAESGKRPALR